MGRSLSRHVAMLLVTLVLYSLVPLDEAYEDHTPRFENFGNETDIESFPYLASVIIKGEHNKRNLETPTCSGAIIDEYHVLTIESCAVNILSQKWPGIRGVVRVGSNCNYKGDLHEIEKYIYRRNYYDNPIPDLTPALIRVKKPFDFSKPGIAPISISKNRLVNELGIRSSRGIVTGWNTHPDDPFASDSCLLFQNEMTIFSNKECKAKYRSRRGYHSIPDDNICAEINSLKDVKFSFKACVGDSGGPLISADKREVIAIANRYLGCDNRVTPSLYTDISGYVPWIMEEMKKI